ncbi:MAG: uroporphyrinogen decarboxylase family protein [Eubacteriales bacterium]
MLKELGMKALRLEMTDHVCRTEYSVLGHSRLLEKVTGISVEEQKNGRWLEAQRNFCAAWDICMNWNVAIGSNFLAPYVSSMGHAVYSEDGSDKNTNVFTLFDSEDEVFAFDPFETLPYREEDEIVHIFNENYKAQLGYLPDTVAMTGIYISCMSGLIEMLGWDMLLTCAGVDPKAFGEFTLRYSLWIERYFKALAKSDAPVVMIHDDIVWTEGAFISPEWYRKYIFPSYKRCFRYLHEARKLILFTSDGNYTEFIDDIAECGINGFVMEPMTDMAYIAEKYGKTHAFIGNADTRILLEGDRDDIYREVKRCMDIGKKYPGFIMAVGNHIPANTPVDSCLWYDEFCRELGKR